MILSQAIIADIVPANERGKYLGPLGAIFGLSAVAGPLLGGFFVDHLTWQWAFYINIPIGIAAFAIAWFALTLPNKKATKRIDIARRRAAVDRHHLPDLLHRLRRRQATTAGTRRETWVFGAGAARRGRCFISSRRARRTRSSRWACSATRSSSTRRRSASPSASACSRPSRFVPTFLQMSSGTSAAASGLLMLPMMVGLMGTSICSGIAITKTGQYKMFPIVGTAGDRRWRWWR